MTSSGSGHRQQSIEDEIIDRYRVIADFARELLLDVLHVDGPQTTAQLRKKVPASKGSLRWDLKRLSEAGFIEEVGDGPTTVWRVVPGALVWTKEHATHPRMAVIVKDLERTVLRRRVDRMQTWASERYTRRWRSEWSDTSISRDYVLRLTPKDLDELDSHIDEWIQAKKVEVAARHADDEVPADEEAVFVAVAGFPFRVGRQ